MRITTKKPPHFFIIAKLKNAFNDIARVFFLINDFGVRIPKKRRAKRKLFHVISISHWHVLYNPLYKRKNYAAAIKSR